MDNSIIKLENVWKIYGIGKTELATLKGVNLEIFPGSFVVILGPSGSGKSTMLNMLGCLDLPTKGVVYLTGKDISKMSEDELAQI
jgi:putative ABC transport system ATP-binding protein